MTKKEILLKQRNAENAPLTDYIGTDGYVWKMIENAMEEYHQAKLKLLGIADVVGRSEQLKAVEELVDFARDVTNVCDLDRLEEILDQL